ncbi:G-protein coupled receptor 1 isoform X2 [Oncorhynchus kisutch]|uniref:G-protein coupled receptor 1 isoform X2 n=1 Tax=Oncorhynchus kisutch TaxID=8019 RepID=UPI0009A0477D|nr:G-protein coupled receptor 1 isoform X2 [Oncorhynchus kisutch]
MLKECILFLFLSYRGSSAAVMEESSEDYDNYTYDYLEYGDLEKEKGGYSQKEAMHILSVIIYSISFVLGVTGNGIVIWVTAFKSKRTVNSIWLLNMAIADFVFVLFLPFSIDYVLRDFHWSFGLVMCKLNSFVSVMNMYASVLFLMILSLDRYVSLVHLSWSQRCRTIRRAWIVCGCVWGVSALLSHPTLIFRDTMHIYGRVVCFNNFNVQDEHTAAVRHITLVAVRTAVGFLLPFSAICVTGILLAIKVHQSEDSVRLSSFSKTVSAVILAFFFCWAPFHTFSLMELSMHSSMFLHTVLKTGFPLATSLAFFNSCVNPLLYMLVGKKVRQLLKRSCLDITKSYLRELSQSISATESVTVADVGPSDIPPPEEPTESSTV